MNRQLVLAFILFSLIAAGCEGPAADDDDTVAGDDDDQLIDADGDGYSTDTDCDDNDTEVHPGADEGCDGIDTDCDGALAADEVDADGDGQAICEGDCDDEDPLNYDGGPELCDGFDNNCDGQIDDGLTFTDYYPDEDGDGYGSCCGEIVNDCEAPSGYVADNGDCDDNDATTYPGAPELCDGLDNDQDGYVDEGC